MEKPNGLNSITEVDNIPKIDIRCPRCTSNINVHEGIKILSCFTCGLQFKVEPRKKIQKLYFHLFAKIKSWIPDWFKTNWSMIITKIGNKIISKTIIYESHCWYCQSPIKSVKADAKKNVIKYQISILWYGNKKCPKGNCKYFFCNECGRCYCDYNNIVLRKPTKNTERKWLEENPN